MSFKYRSRRFIARYIKPFIDYPILWFSRCKIRLELMWAIVVFCMFPLKKATSGWFKLKVVRNRGNTLLPLPYWVLITLTVIQGVAAALILGRGTFRQLLRQEYDIQNSYSVDDVKSELLLLMSLFEQAKRLGLEGNHVITYILVHLAWNDLSDKNNKIDEVLLTDKDRTQLRLNYLTALLKHEDKDYRAAEAEEGDIQNSIAALLTIPAEELLSRYDIDPSLSKNDDKSNNQPIESTQQLEKQSTSEHPRNPSIDRLHWIVDERDTRSRLSDYGNLLMVNTLDEKQHAVDATFLYQVASNAHKVKSYLRKRCAAMTDEQKQNLKDQLDIIQSAIENQSVNKTFFDQRNFPFWYDSGFQAILHDFLGRHPEHGIKKYYLENTLRVMCCELSKECEGKQDKPSLKKARKIRAQAEKDWLDLVKDLAVASARLEQNLFKHRAEIGDSGEEGKFFTEEELIQQELIRLKQIYHPESEQALEQILRDGVEASKKEREYFDRIAKIKLEQQKTGVLHKNSNNLDLHPEIDDTNKRLIEDAFSVVLRARYHNNDGLYGKHEARANKFGKICMWSNVIIFACLGVATSVLLPWYLVIASTFLSIFSSYAWAGPDIISGIRSFGQACDQGWYMHKKRMKSKSYVFKLVTLLLLSVISSLITIGLLYFTSTDMLISFMNWPVIRFIPQLIAMALKLFLFHGTPFMVAYYFATIMTIGLLALATIGSLVLAFEKMSKIVTQVRPKELYQKFKESKTKTLIIAIVLCGFILAFVSAYINAEGDRSGLLKAFAWMSNPFAFALGMTSLVIGIVFYLYESIEGANQSALWLKNVITRIWNGKEPNRIPVEPLSAIAPSVKQVQDRAGNDDDVSAGTTGSITRVLSNAGLGGYAAALDNSARHTPLAESPGIHRSPIGVGSGADSGGGCSPIVPASTPLDTIVPTPSV